MKFNDSMAMAKEIASAEKFRDLHHNKTKDMVASTVGPYWGHEPVDGEVDQEKFAYEFSTWMLGQMVGEKPSLKITSRRKSDAAQKEAESMESGINRWTHDTRFKKELMELATDSLYSWGVSLTTLQDNERLRGVEIPTEVWNSEGSPLQPVVQRLKQEMFAADPAATSWETARYKFHRYVRDKESLLKYAEENDDEGWDIEAIRALVPTTDARELGRDGKDVPDRDEVMIYEVWVSEYEMDVEDVPWKMEKGEEPTPEHGYHGAILTMGRPHTGGSKDSDGSGWLREPIPYYGPPTGPYTLYGIYPVAGELYPLGPIIAVQSLAEELNRADKGMSASAEAAKNVLLFDEKNTVMAQRIKNAEHTGYLGIPGFQKDDVLPNVQIGGLTGEQIMWRNDRRALLDRVSGFGDQQRGKVSGGGTTATDSTIADSNADIRTDLVKAQFMDCVSINYEKVAWYLFNEPDIVFMVDAKEEAAPIAEGGMQPDAQSVAPEPSWFKGGPDDKGKRGNFYDLELVIDPYSMKRTNEGMEQRRMLEQFEILMNWSKLIAASPLIALAVNWADVFRMMGDTMNTPMFGSLIDMDMVKQAAGAMLEQQQMEAAGANGAGPQGTPNHGGGVAMPGQQQGVRA